MRRLHNIFAFIVFSSALFAAAACNTIFEEEQDCSPKIKFEFRKHRQALQTGPDKAVDAFSATVGSVHLFIYDASGRLVLEQYASTDQLKSAADLQLGADSEKCYMPVDLEPGQYRFVAWCGLDASDQNNAFALREGSRAAAYERCDVKRTAAGQPVNEAKYEALYHGTTGSVNVRAMGEVIPVQLTKNTNDIAVWVQHATTTFEQGDYEVVYTDANGSMKFTDNTLASDEQLEYHPHTISYLSTSTEYNGELIESGALVAHLSTARLLADHKGDARLEVRSREGVTVFSIPFVQYLLEMQTFTPDGQYYLDCEDTFNCSFYLSGDGERWIPARIIINNWVRVPDQKDDLGGGQ